MIESPFNHYITQLDCNDDSHLHSASASELFSRHFHARKSHQAFSSRSSQTPFHFELEDWNTLLLENVDFSESWSALNWFSIQHQIHADTLMWLKMRWKYHFRKYVQKSSFSKTNFYLLMKVIIINFRFPVLLFTSHSSTTTIHQYLVKRFKSN